MSVSECTVIISLAYSSENLKRLDAVKYLWALPPLPLKRVYDLYTGTEGLQHIIRHTLILEHGPYDSEGDSYVCKLLGCSPDDLLNTLHVTDEMFFVNYPSGENL
jgi:hypothetical protein